MSAISPKAVYIHGNTPDEQDRLSALNTILNQRYLKLIHLNKGEKVLDVGSGLGQLSRAMAKKVGHDGFVLGIERDAIQMKQAEILAKSDSTEPKVAFRLGSAYELPLLSEEWGTFDLVHARFLLEHLSAPKKAVQQMVKALKKGGRIILSDDDHATFRPTPEPLGFSLIWTAYCRSYERIGNDPYIGKRLVTLLHQSGINTFKK